MEWSSIFGVRLDPGFFACLHRFPGSFSFFLPFRVCTCDSHVPFFSCPYSLFAREVKKDHKPQATMNHLPTVTHVTQSPAIAATVT